MIVFRLSKEKYKNDLSGIGAEKYGGRWNNKGTRVVYTAESRALANLEVAVHVALYGLPKNYYLTSIEIPEKLIIEYNQKRLKNQNWRSNPPLDFTQTEGDNFINDQKGLILKVPSAIVQGDHNYLINPLHHDFGKVKIVETNPFNFDRRLFGPI
ncbi:RES family NAD+ phosphorylase [uncultured Kriegella sp.]|uniref:RES family NAD+ phosphorylase n=1 Tax=uncultured Kriegella sp. TaxID=1798910 RepID=UPI0030DA3DDF|tara:strand:+ start:349087 stop:349551 length:465 start_codon:yes stop_codon:yes gene_type:complete